MKIIIITVVIAMVAGATIYNAMVDPSLITYILAGGLTGLAIMYSVASGILFAKWVKV